MKRLGPELKMPKLKGGELKVPPFLSDLYWDLRDRRLLPVVALVLVAIVAAPFLLGGGSDENAAPSIGPIEGTTASKPTLTVVQAEPGLRNYKKRLRRRRPSDPFRPRFTAPMLHGAKLQSTSTTSSTPSTSSSTTTKGSPGTGSATSNSQPAPSPNSPPATTAPGGPTENAGPPHNTGSPHNTGKPEGLVYYAFAIDVQVTKIESKKGGGTEKTGPTMHHGVLPPTPLPGAKAPVVTYIGVSPKTHKPLFVVSPDVSSVYGEGKCVAGTDTCQVIELEQGFPETFLYGENDVRYKINVVKIEPVVTGHS
jgi:hypothetical protein